jgi:hypothetical protein
VVAIVGLPDAGALWPRLLALPMAVIGFFYLQAARNRVAPSESRKNDPVSGYEFFRRSVEY